MVALRDFENHEDSLDYPLQYTLDFKFEEEDQGRGRAGAPILGAYRSRHGGHRLNALVLKALFADADAWTSPLVTPAPSPHA